MRLSRRALAAVLLAAPAGTLPDIVQRLHAAVTKVMRDPPNIRRFDEAGLHPAIMELSDDAAFRRADSARWDGVVRRGNIRIDG
jgi:tripartite-type tricarboxylate transporter receptor subunit TctC